AKQKPMPASVTHRATSSGPQSMRTPRASRTSALPVEDDAARLPCLHTRPPAPATTSAASVETLIVWARSPPVPTMSTTSTSGGSSRRSGAASMASSMPLSSSTVSPFIRRATMKAAICAEVAAPSSTSAMASRARSAGRSRPAVRSARTDGHPSKAMGSGGPTALADDAPPLPLGGAAPHALLLADRQGVLEAGFAHVAPRAHLLGVLGFLVGGGVEDQRVEPA